MPRRPAEHIETKLTRYYLGVRFFFFCRVGFTPRKLTRFLDFALGPCNADGAGFGSFSLHYTTRSDVTVAGAQRGSLASTAVPPPGGGGTKVGERNESARERERGDFAIAIVARQARWGRAASRGEKREGETTGGYASARARARGSTARSKRGWEGRLVRIEARTGREDSHGRRRDNGSNELTRTPEPRLSLSSRSRPLSPLAPRRIIALPPSLSLPPFASFRSLPPLLLRVKSFVLFLLRHRRHRVKSYLPSLFLLFAPSVPLDVSLSVSRFVSRARAHAFSLVLSLSLASFASGPVQGQPITRGIGTFYRGNKDGQSDYYENKSA